MANLLNFRLLAVSVLLLPWVSTVHAQHGFAPEGLTTYREQNTSFSEQPSTVLAGGELVHAWSSTDLTGFKRVYAQIVSANGDIVFPESPRPLSAAGHNAFNAEVIAATDGAAILAWAEPHAGGSWTIMLQRLNIGGGHTWADGGAVGFESVAGDASRPRLYPDANGGCFISVYSPEIRLDRVRAIGSDGSLRQEWPHDGVFSDTLGFAALYPDAWGGLWFVNHDGTFNRITTDGRRYWHENRPIISPIEELGLAETKSNGDYLYALFGEWFRTAMEVYDSSGESVASDLILNRQQDADGVWWCWKVLPRGDVLLAYTRYYYGGCSPRTPNGPQCGGDYYPDGMPWIIRYNPFAACPDSGINEKLPWGSLGIQIPGNNDYSIETDNAEMAQVGDVTILLADKYLYALNSDGHTAWQNEPLMVPIAHDNSIREGNLLPADGYAWITTGIQYHAGCSKVTAGGELATGRDPVWIIPHQSAPLGNISIVPLRSNQLGIFGEDECRGLIGQRVTGNGEIAAPLNGQTLIPGCVSSSDWHREQGTVGGYLYLWQQTGGSSGRLRLLDENNQLVLNRSLDFGGEGWFQWRAPQVVDNDRDQLLFCLRSDSNAFRLYEYNLEGERIAEATCLSPSTNPWLDMIQYWEDEGWVVVTESYSGDQHFVGLLDDQFRPVWWHNMLSQPVQAIYQTDSSITLAGMSYDSHNDFYFARRLILSTSGEIRSSDSTRLFTPNMYPSDFDSPLCIAGANGSFWFLGEKINNLSRSYRIQLLGPDWTRALGDSGLVIGEGREWNDQCQLLPDHDGGSWIVWDFQAKIKALHLDSGGKQVGGVHLGWAKGFDVFNEDGHSLIGSAIDPNTDRVWVVSRCETTLAQNVSTADIRVQILSEEWNGITKPSFSQPQKFELSAYPNPFNSLSRITFSLPSASQVLIRVYDLSGRSVATLVDRQVQAGEHSIMLNAGALTTGVYLVKMAAGNFNAVQKVILIK